MTQRNIQSCQIAKAIRAIESCVTIEQLKTAKCYTRLALKSSLSPAYTQLVEAAEEYFILNKWFKNLIETHKNKL